VRAQPDSKVFLLLPGDTPHYVYGTIRSVREKRSGKPQYSVEFDESRVAHLDEEVKLYYQDGGVFWCQPAVATVVDDTRPGTIVTFDCRTSPRKGEHRRTDRIDAYLSGVTASVQGNPACLVINISNKGVAIVSSVEHTIDDSVQVEVAWNAESWVGQMILRHEKKSVRDSLIYGLECSAEKDGDALREGLKRITATVMFQQGVMEEMLAEQREN
jgi:hypothetical protein